MSTFVFTPEQFLHDLTVTAEAVGAGLDLDVTRRVLDVYEDSFREGAVLWRTTDEPGGALNYRFYERRPRDTVAQAAGAGLLGAGDDAARLISCWSALYPDSTELCDFDAACGLVKTWVYLGGVRPVAEVLSAAGVPDAFRRHEARWRRLGLRSVRHVAVDHQHGTANLYFRTREGITEPAVARFAELAGAQPPHPTTYADMERFTAPTGFTLSVTLALDSGEIERVGIYALRLPAGRFPAMGSRLTTFFRTAPSRDRDEMNAVAWSLGAARSYLKAERSYCGDLVALMTGWNSPMTVVGGSA